MEIKAFLTCSLELCVPVIRFFENLFETISARTEMTFIKL